MLKRVKVTIEGIRPYLQHRRPSSQQEVEQMNKIIKILQKNPFDIEASKQEAEISAYKNNQGYYIPAEQIQEALTHAGARLQVKGQGKRTYKDYMKSYVFVEPEEIPITPQQYQIDSRYVKVGPRFGIIRNRPRFDNWKASFNLLITDDTLPLKDIKEILEIAGSRVGIGDYRPRFGLFAVTKFEE